MEQPQTTEGNVPQGGGLSEEEAFQILLKDFEESQNKIGEGSGHDKVSANSDSLFTDKDILLMEALAKFDGQDYQQVPFSYYPPTETGTPVSDIYYTLNHTTLTHDVRPTLLPPLSLQVYLPLVTGQRPSRPLMI